MTIQKHSEFEDKFNYYILIKYKTHQDFAAHLTQLLLEDYKPIWDTFRITPIGESYVLILYKPKIPKMLGKIIVQCRCTNHVEIKPGTAILDAFCEKCNAKVFRDY